MQVKAVWASRVPPDEEVEDLYEFSLYWYRFFEELGSRPSNCRPAVWIEFSRIEHLKRIQINYPEATLGPSSSYTQGLIFTETFQDAQTVQEKVLSLLQNEETFEENELYNIIQSDSMEDL